LSQNWRRSNIDEVVRRQVELALCGVVLLSVCVESCWVDVVWLFDGWELMTPSKVSGVVED
jgi:hypothetical protein